MVTPFTDDGSLDPDGAVSLARHLADNGSDALVVAGTTGESPVLSHEEKRILFETVCERSPLPVIAGATTNDTAHSVELVREAEKAGAAAILAVTPYYNRPSQTGLERHFSAIAEATSLPVILYDIPIRTGRRIAAETTLSLVRRHPNVVAVKDATGDPAGTARLLASAPASFEVYSGDEPLTLPLLSLGAVGAISVASHWVGPELAEMAELFFSGEVERAAALNRALIPFVSFQSSDDAPNPMPAKAVLRAAGLPAGQCRLPHGAAPSWLEQAAEVLVGELRAWRNERVPHPVEA